MDFNLTKEQRDIQRAARKLAQNKLAPKAEYIDRVQEFPFDNFRDLIQLGFVSMTISPKYGGGGCDELSCALVIEEIARACASTADILDTHLILCSKTIERWGNEMQKYFLRYLKSISYIGSFAITEPDAGSDIANIKTTAIRKDDHYYITGQKTFITNGNVAGVSVVFANVPNLEKGMTAFIIPNGTTGFIKGKPFNKVGMRGATNCEYFFDNCKVHKGNRLGKEGQGMEIALSSLDYGRIGIAAQATGIAQAVLDECIKYAKDRNQFGKPIAKNQAISFKIADMATDINAARLLTYRAAHLADSGSSFSKEAAMAKVFASETAMKAATWGVQIFGGYGYMMESPMQRYFRDAKLTEIYEGTSEIQRMVIAKKLLK